jgi:hypothetical protein
MVKRIALLGGIAALVAGLFADDSRACIFGRRHRCACQSVVVYYYPCRPAVAPERTATPARSEADEEVGQAERAIKEFEKATKALADDPIFVPATPEG